MSKNIMTLKSGSEIMENNAIRSGTHDFLLTFRSNHRPILHRFRDKRRFKSKITNFPTPVYFGSPLKEFLLELGIDTGSEKNRNDGAIPDGLKGFKIGLAV